MPDNFDVTTGAGSYAAIAEAKKNLSALIDGLKDGTPVFIVDRGRPVARLEPATGDLESGQYRKLSRLLSKGLVRPRRARPPRALFGSQPPHANFGASAVDALIEERRAGKRNNNLRILLIRVATTVRSISQWAIKPRRLHNHRVAGPHLPPKVHRTS
jgi:prevent-host-death family protein